MALPIKLAGYPWDHITPLLTGDVKPEGIDLTYDTANGLGPVTEDPSYDGGEASLGRYFLDIAKGDRSFVGLPVFPMFQLRHRCYLVKRGTTIGSVKELEGKRVGMDGWPNSGNTWTKTTLAQEGVDIWKITWVIAPLYGAPDATHGTVPPGAPANVVGGTPGKSLRQMLLDGEIDVMVAAFMPDDFFKPDCPLVPMMPDYRAAEIAYYQAQGYIPAHHIVKLRRSVVEENPWVVKSLFAAYDASKKLWVERRRHLADTSPFLLGELSASAAVFGDDWQPYGLEPNLKLLTDFAQGQEHQKLVAKAVDPQEAFADAARLLG